MIFPISLLMISASARILTLPYEPSDSLEALNCNNYACKNEAAIFTPETCSWYHRGFYYLSPCTNSTLTCELETGRNSTCTLPTPEPPTPTYSSYPGEPCLTQFDCVYGTCNGERCVGSVEGQSCVNNAKCDPGFKCNGSTCEKQIGLGGLGCREDEDCVNDGACNIDSDRKGVCI